MPPLFILYLSIICFREVDKRKVLFVKFLSKMLNVIDDKDIPYLLWYCFSIFYKLRSTHMDKTIHQIIEDEDIITLYQPIVNLATGEIMGYEALTRGPEWSKFFSPIAMIQEAEEKGVSFELDYLMRKKAILNLKTLEIDKKIFINIHPNFIKNEALVYGRTLEVLKEKGIAPKNIVFELTERAMITDYTAFNEILNHYRFQNYQIAIDDVGAGYSGLRTIQEIKPNYIKIDMDLIRNINEDPIKEALIVAFLNFSLTTNIQLIAEGIETEKELKKIIELGVQFGQGYFLQRPKKDCVSLRDDVVEAISGFNLNRNELNIFTDAKNNIGTFVEQSCVVEAKMRCLEVKEVLEESYCEGVCVVKNNRPIGIIMRENLLYALSTQYGHALYANKTISHIMDTDFLVVDAHENIADVSQKAMAREQSKAYDIIIVTKNRMLLGSISINQLLRILITVQTKMAKELNPLTYLPGNILINQRLHETIKKGKCCAVIYLDVDFFKPYNDLYGFEKGDRILKNVADLITRVVKSKCLNESFIGHIGGDDFLYIVDGDYSAAEEICHDIIREFDAIRPSFYNTEDNNNGYIISKNRTGIEQRFELLTLSMAGLYGPLDRFDSVGQLSRYISRIKKEAKEIEGHVILIQHLNE